MGKKSQELPQQFSSLMGMGNPVEIFPAKHILINSIMAVLFLLGSGIPLMYALSIVWQRWGRYYPPAVYQAVLPWLISFAALLGIALLIGWRTFLNRKKAAVVFINGFAYSDHKGVQTWRWDQIQDLTAYVIRHYTYFIYTGTTRKYTLLKSTGEKLVLNDSLKNLETFYSLVENNTLQLRYQRLAEDYNNGKTVAFGPVNIGKKLGIQIGKKAFPWEEIKEVAIHNGILSIKKKDGGWFSGASAQAGKIPNLHVLLSIINQILGLQTGQEV